MRQLKRGLVYFSLFLLYGIVILLGAAIQLQLQINLERTAKGFYSVLIFQHVFSIIYGILLGIPRLIKESKKIGYWTIDWIKIVFVSLPALIVSAFPIMVWVIPIDWPSLLIKINALSYGLFFFARIALGYSLIDSLTRIEKNIKSNVESNLHNIRTTG